MGRASGVRPGRARSRSARRTSVDGRKAGAGHWRVSGPSGSGARLFHHAPVVTAIAEADDPVTALFEAVTRATGVPVQLESY